MTVAVRDIIVSALYILHAVCGTTWRLTEETAPSFLLSLVNKVKYERRIHTCSNTNLQNYLHVCVCQYIRYCVR